MTYLKVFTQICIKPKQILMNQFVSRYLEIGTASDLTDR